MIQGEGVAIVVLTITHTCELWVFFNAFIKVKIKARYKYRQHKSSLIFQQTIVTFKVNVDRQQSKSGQRGSVHTPYCSHKPKI